ncbi:hypothetical protein HHK36_017205 [Tetracentron sinense]|uniref:Uncharacterized protein n=1 Tax=Tetracentron sinense TaxID=13715 RepID=A0A835DCC4_TETSI|nr:hypothetical protein HHK36_017205 [Tetracentron sinense]
MLLQFTLGLVAYNLWVGAIYKCIYQNTNGKHLPYQRCACTMERATHGSAAEEFLVSIMELSEKRVARQEAAQTRTGSAQPVIISDERELSRTVITEGASSSSSTGIEDWLISIMPDRTSCTTQDKKTRIQKVPPMLREIEANRKCYDPLVVAIGPYHHGKPELEQMEKLKSSTIVQQFLSGSDKPITDYYKKIKKVVKDARDCYAEGSTENFNDEEFALMMFLDGCFILHFIDCVVHEKFPDMKMKSHDIIFVRQDLFLLENQIPNLVLKELMSLRYPGDKGKNNIHKFITEQINAMTSNPTKRKGSSACKFFFGGKKDDRREDSISGPSNDDGLHLLQLVRTQLVGNHDISKPKSQDDWQSFRSVKELNTAGIECIRSHKCCLDAVEFKKSCIYGKLYLPPITIDDSTKPLFLNLIAYERCPDAPDDDAISSYICFMDALIDRAEDVKELRSKGILLNFLGSDEQVADLFNQISTNLVLDPHSYGRVKGEIEKHYNNTCRVLLAEFYTTHFRTPWATIASFAALVVIILTFLQTIYTLYPAKSP